ncbi:MAG TPA: hypothetical protein VGF24_17850 [Vicinamibacterales bacterium]|jgi:hypothetical protein
MQITKLDAARRQIDSAIDLYFNGGDAISIHTLVGAAHILITDLSNAANQETLIKKHIRSEKRWEFERAIRTPQNFLKHAAKDPHAVLDFDPHATELLLLIEVETFRELTGSITDSMNAFLTYAAATWGKVAFEAIPGDVLTGVSMVAAQVPKQEFFSLCMQALGKSSGVVSD